MHPAPIGLTSLFFALLFSLPSARAEPTGHIRIEDVNSKACTLPAPPAGSGKTWQYELNTVGSACFGTSVRKLEMVNLPSAAKILITDAYWCNEKTEPSYDPDTKNHWIKLKTTRHPTSVPLYSIQDLYAFQPGAIISPGLQVVDKYVRPGGKLHDTASCVRITASADINTPPVPEEATAVAAKWTDWQPEPNSGIECAANTVMTGREHKGDETGSTRHQCARVTQEGHSATVGKPEWSIPINESDREGEGFYFSCPRNTVMTGRSHDGDENGDTQYACATLTVNGRQLEVIPDAWMWNGSEKNSKFECIHGKGVVLVGRQHQGDENGVTLYRCAKIR